MSGFPIRTPWDHSLVDSSPRPIAASHVLHRLLVPRHPPSALDNLTTENKMLASTVQFSTNDQPTTHRKHQTTRLTPDRYVSQTVPGTETTTHPRASATPRLGCSFRTQQGAHHHPPAASPEDFHTAGAEAPAVVLTPQNRCQWLTRQCLRHRAPQTTNRGPRATGRLSPSSRSLERR